MDYIDILFIIPLGWFAFKGFTKGFIAELAMLAALLLGVLIAVQFSEKIGEIAGIKGENAKLVAFVATFLIVVIVVYFIGQWISRVSENLSLGFANSLLGAAFGVLKTAFVMSVCIYFINKIDKQRFVFAMEMQEKSLLYSPIEKLAPAVFTKLDEHEQEQMVEELKEKSK